MSAMFTKLTTKIALRKAGIPSNALSFPDTTGGDSKDGSGGGSSPFAGAKDAWQNLQVPKALKSWTTPPPAAVEVAPAPVLGTRAPRDRSGKLELPPLDGRPSIVIFLRHTGCPFAEKTFIEARRLSNKFPRLSFILVSHASKAATDRWVSQVGGAWSMTVVVDPEREVYAAWGLGVSTTYHLLNPWTQMAMRRLGTEGGIWAREVDGSANRWLVGGAWGVDEGECCFSFLVLVKEGVLWSGERLYGFAGFLLKGGLGLHRLTFTESWNVITGKAQSEAIQMITVGDMDPASLTTLAVGRELRSQLPGPKLAKLSLWYIILSRTFEADFFPVGTIRYGSASKTADDIPDLVEACKALGAY